MPGLDPLYFYLREKRRGITRYTPPKKKVTRVGDYICVRSRGRTICRYTKVIQPLPMDPAIKKRIERERQKTRTLRQRYGKDHEMLKKINECQREMSRKGVPAPATWYICKSRVMGTPLGAPYRKYIKKDKKEKPRPFIHPAKPMPVPMPRSIRCFVGPCPPTARDITRRIVMRAGLGKGPSISVSKSVQRDRYAFTLHVSRGDPRKIYFLDVYSRSGLGERVFSSCNVKGSGTCTAYVPLSETPTRYVVREDGRVVKSGRLGPAMAGRAAAKSAAVEAALKPTRRITVVKPPPSPVKRKMLKYGVAGAIAGTAGLTLMPRKEEKEEAKDREIVPFEVSKTPLDNFAELVDKYKMYIAAAIVALFVMALLVKGRK